jgi:chromosome segregation ATPase
MNNLQQKIFIVLATALCGLCAYQWYFQTVQREAIEKRNQIIFQQRTDIQNYTNSIKDMDAEIAQMQQRVTELKQTVVSNNSVIIFARRENARLQSDNDLLTNQIVQYQAGVEKLEATLTNTYQGIKKQNASVKELVDQRDRFVQKYNDSIKERNAIVARYNDVVDRLNKLQAAAAAAK